MCFGAFSIWFLRIMGSAYPNLKAARESLGALIPNKDPSQHDLISIICFFFFPFIYLKSLFNFLHMFFCPLSQGSHQRDEGGS
jgi:hypothetical protein